MLCQNMDTVIGAGVEVVDAEGESLPLFGAAFRRVVIDAPEAIFYGVKVL